MRTKKQTETFKGWTIEFERNEEWTYSGKRVTWSWFIPKTGDWETRYPTKAAAVKHVHRFVTGLQSEGVQVFGKFYGDEDALVQRIIWLRMMNLDYGESDDRVTELNALREAASEKGWEVFV